MRPSLAMRVLSLLLIAPSAVGAALHLQSGAPSNQARASALPYLETMRLAAVDLGSVTPATPLSTVLTLANPHAAREAADLAALYTPSSPRFGHYLTAAALAARYGPVPATVDKVRAALHRLGMSADWHPGNDWLIASGSARAFAAAFKVKVRWYRSPRGSRFYAADRAPALPAALRPAVISVGQISSYFEPSRFTIPPGGLAPTDLLGAYDITPLRNLGLDGAGQTVVFFESDGFAQSDLDTFTAKLGLPAMQPVIKAGPALAAGAETEMDLEVVHEIAPAAKLVIYNFDFQAAAKKATSNAQFLQMQLDLQNQMVNENPGTVISQSWGLCEKPMGSAIADAYKNLYDHADALGESVFVSTGDNAAYECLRLLPRGTLPGPDNLAVPLPADAPGVTATGGTRLSASTNGGWYNETVWEQPAETNGTGGGVSQYYSRPSWQQGPGVSDPQYNPRNMRSIPDVSADADPSSGVSVFIATGNGSIWTGGGGTSQSAPIWAGITALLNQYLQGKQLHPAGFMNPALYQIAANPTPYQAFHDVTMGNNLYYPATPGYDMATGLGTPDVWNLARDVEAYQRGGGQ